MGSYPDKTEPTHLRILGAGLFLYSSADLPTQDNPVSRVCCLLSELQGAWDRMPKIKGFLLSLHVCQLVELERWIQWASFLTATLKSELRSTEIAHTPVAIKIKRRVVTGFNLFIVILTSHSLLLEEGRRCDVEIIQIERLGNPCVALLLSLTYYMALHRWHNFCGSQFLIFKVY